MNNPHSFKLAAVLAGLSLSLAMVPPAADAAQVSTQGTRSAEARLKARGLDPAQVKRGRAIFNQHCVECHGAEGKGKTKDWRVPDANGNYPPPPLDDSAYAWHHPTEALLESVHIGSPQGFGIMPRWEKQLSEREMRDVVAYIKSLWSDEAYRQWLDIERQSKEP